MNKRHERRITARGAHGRQYTRKGAEMRYAVRVEAKMVRDETFEYDRKPLSSPGDAVKFFRDLQNADVEKLVAVYLDAKNRINAIGVWPGTLDRAAIYPREIVRGIILSASCGVILFHNHPSGDPAPSAEDKAITKAISDALATISARVLDHIIIGLNNHYSMMENNLI